MALSFEELIRDVQNFNDAYEVPITRGTGESAVTEKLRLGDVRGQLSNTLARYEAALQTEREQRNALEQTLRTLQTAQPAREEHRQAPTPAGAPSDDDLNADPWSKALLNRVRHEVEQAANNVRGEHNQFADLSRNGVKALTTLVLRMIADQEFRKHDNWPKDYDAGRAFKEAGDKGYIDKFTGLPDLGRLHHDLTEESRIEKRAAALAEKMREDERKAEAEKNQSRFNKLGIPNNIRSKTPKKEKQHATLQEWFQDDEASLPTDDEVRAAGGLLNIIR